jgi:hypothetical protein
MIPSTVKNGDSEKRLSYASGCLSRISSRMSLSINLSTQVAIIQNRSHEGLCKTTKATYARAATRVVARNINPHVMPRMSGPLPPYACGEGQCMREKSCVFVQVSGGNTGVHPRLIIIRRETARPTIYLLPRYASHHHEDRPRDKPGYLLLHVSEMGSKSRG